MNRSRILTAIGGVAVVLIAATVCVSDPTSVPGPESPPATLDIEALVARADALIDVILEQHISPPTRQELWFGGVTGLVQRVRTQTRRTGAKIMSERGLFLNVNASQERISHLATRGQFAEFVKELWLTLRQSAPQPPVRDLEQAFVEGILLSVPGGLRLIPAKEALVQEQLRGNRYIGTGIALNFDQKEKCPRIAVAFPGGPLQRAGGLSGDLILKVNDRDAHGFGVTEMVDLLRGEEGTVVTLVVKSEGANERTLAVTRGPVVFPTLEGFGEQDSDYRIPSVGWVRYVKIRQINGSTVHDLRKLERQFQSEGAAAVILDFRTGGSTDEDAHHTALLADALLDGGSIGRLRTRHRVREFHADRDRLFRDLPIAILVDRNTRGGPEWIAAALQDNHAATLVGEATAGVALAFDRIAVPGSGELLELAIGIYERSHGPPIHVTREPRRPAPTSDVSEDESADDEDDDYEDVDHLVGPPVRDGRGGVRPDVELDEAALNILFPPNRTGNPKALRPIRPPQQPRVPDPIEAAAIKELESRLGHRASRGQTPP